MWWKTINYASKNSFWQYSSKNTDPMSDRTQTFCNLSLHLCNNGISFASPRTQACELGLLWARMVHKIFACFAYWWGMTSYDWCIYQSKLLLRQFWNSLMICDYQVSCKQYDCLHERCLWKQKNSQVKAILAFTMSL